MGMCVMVKKWNKNSQKLQEHEEPCSQLIISLSQVPHHVATRWAKGAWE